MFNFEKQTSKLKKAIRRITMRDSNKSTRVQVFSGSEAKLRLHVRGSSFPPPHWGPLGTLFHHGLCAATSFYINEAWICCPLLPHLVSFLHPPLQRAIFFFCAP